MTLTFRRITHGTGMSFPQRQAALPVAPVELLRRLYGAVVAAAQPERLVAQNLPDPPRGRTIVVGAGKASGAMARAFEARWKGPLSGVVAVPHAVAAVAGASGCMVPRIRCPMRPLWRPRD